MATVVVLEDGWDGHYVLSTAVHQAGHQVLAVQHPSLLPAALRGAAADVLLVDAAIPGVSLGGIEALAAESGLPVIATGYGPWAPVRGLTAFVQKPASPGALVHALESALARRAACAA
jgi:CheY-like chemotaxis protein